MPNHAGIEAMLRSTGLRVTARPAEEIYVCEPGPKGDRHWESQLEAIFPPGR